MKKRNLFKVLIFFIILGIFLILVNSFLKEKPKESPKIGEIVSNPKLYEGKVVILDGKYGGWSGNLPCDYGKLALETKSDVIIYDETGCIYMTGKVEILYHEGPLNPWSKESIGKRIKVRGKVKLINGKPILGGVR